METAFGIKGTDDPTVRLVNKFLAKVTDNTVIQAGHFSYKSGPTGMDTRLFEIGVMLYQKTRSLYHNIALAVLVDDVYDVESNQERRSFELNTLPTCYLDILEKRSIPPAEIMILSQERLREKGRQLLRDKGISRTAAPQCRLIVAAGIRKYALAGYQNALFIYDTDKTDNGQKLIGGGQMAIALFGNLPITVHNYIFSDETNYKYLSMMLGNIA